MCMDNLAYARIAYKSFPRSARHLMQLIGSHQNPATGWAYLSYACLSDEASLTRRRVIQLVALLEAKGVLDVRRGHGRGHVNFYRILREEDGLPVPPKRGKKVKSDLLNTLELLTNPAHKVVENKERKEKADEPASLSSHDLTRLGLTPGSYVWKLLVGSDDSSQQQPGT